MAVKILPTSQIRDRISAVLNELSRTGEPIFVTRFSRPEAVLLSIARYNAMMDLLEDLEDERDSELGRRIEEARASHHQGNSITLKEITDQAANGRQRP